MLGHRYFNFALVLALLFSPVPSFAGEEEVPGKSAAARLISSIETLYGKEVRIEQVRHANPDYCGEASVTPDGTPVVKVNVSVESKDLVIVHELLHLQLRQEGFPRYTVSCPPDLFLDAETLSGIRRMVNDMRDLIEHSALLFPLMEEMGLNPYGTMKAIYRRNLDSGYVDSFRNPVYQTFNYMKIALESNDAKIVADLEQHYMENKWGAVLEQGRRLVHTVRSQSAKSPEAMVALTVSCLNTLYQRKVVFEASKWSIYSRGSNSERVVGITIRPANS
jgi:hypothetical protein